MSKLTGIILLLLIALPAQAEDYTKDDVRGDTYCYPAKNAAKTIRAIASVTPERNDIVAINLKPKFLIYDDGRLPQRYYIKDTEKTVDFTIEADGDIPDFISKVQEASQDAKLCIDDPARAGLDSDDESLYFEMGLTPYYQNISGRHDMAELAEGAKDGRSQYKKMIPAAFRFLMPDTRCLHIRYEKNDIKPQIYAEVSGELLPLETEYYNQGFVLHFNDLKDLGAQALIIKGGEYKLSPVPSIKTMKRYGVGLPRGPKAKIAKTH